VPAGEGVFVRSSLAADQAAIDELDRTLLIVGASATLFAALLGILVAGGLSAGLRDAAAVARRVTAGETDARVGATGSGEVADLSVALDRMTETLEARIDAERQFAADVAHELRTPVTGLVSAAELLDDSRPAEIVRERTRELRGLVEDLLQISRLDAGIETADRSQVQLAAVARDAVSRTGVTASVVEVSPGHLFTDERRVERVLENLLRNARSHGAPPIVVRVRERSISVQDAGSGFPPELLIQGPGRFRRGAGASTTGGGSGLGLSIAAGQAEVLGATLDLANPEDGGAIATLTFPSDG
jgi:signal transduction histidine kinase